MIPSYYRKLVNTVVPHLRGDDPRDISNMSFFSDTPKSLATRHLLSSTEDPVMLPRRTATEIVNKEEEKEHIYFLTES